MQQSIEADTAQNQHGCNFLYRGHADGIQAQEPEYFVDLQKQFYKTMLQTRKERILDFAMEKLRKREKSKELEAR